MASTVVSSVSALILGIAGLALLFAPDVVLPAVVPAFPRSAVWLGQLLAAGWLGLAILNWLQRRLVLGGIYGRPVVLANLVLYPVSALSLLRALVAGTAPPLLWPAFGIAGLMAIAYGALLLLGPFDHTGRSAN